MEKNSGVFSITEKKISPIEWNREIFKFFIVSLLMAHPIFHQGLPYAQRLNSKTISQLKELPLELNVP
jgi:hypothetical protein